MNILALVTDSATGIFSFVEAIETVQAIVLILGLILLVVEIFAPGFGIAGGAGLALIILGIVLTARNPQEAMVMIAILLVVLAIGLRLSFVSHKGSCQQRLVLGRDPVVEQLPVV